MDANMAVIGLLALPFIGAPLTYLADRLALRRGDQPRFGQWIALAILLLSLYCLSVFWFSSPLQQGTWVLVGSVALHWDGLSVLLALTTILLGSAVTLFSGSYLAEEKAHDKYFSLLLLMIGSIIGLGASNDLFNLWLWFELMAVSTYLLVAFYPQEKGSLEAGVKYLVQSAVGSVLILLAISITYTYAGTLQLDGIRARFSDLNSALWVAGVLFVIGFGIKAALVPLHTWLPDAHAQAPSGISAMLSGVVIEAGLVAMLRALMALGAAEIHWGILLMGFGAINMLLGNLLALRQHQIKRLLAFSSVAQVGYMLAGIGVGLAYQQPVALAGGMFHLFTHALMKGLAFLAVGALLYALVLSHRQHTPLTLEDVCGAAQRYPLASLTLAIALLGLGGLPPLAGFMSKWQILVGGFSAQTDASVALMILAGLNSVLSLGYYAPIVNRLYRHQPSEAVLRGNPVPNVMILPLLILSLGILVLGFVPSLMNPINDWAALSVLGLGMH
ncbi:proton-conducting transporter membrane subunit [uncultured Thermanaerothrix sp.]|uniref:complex I subunit 5 family protein n=1 Tax=uncultured Thermanaerothrix sp. TaxID=1195149 RepID=UPI0026289236|nr:proton-conducting transporter membrane subunit [uncultured Thermanaerothrix sp.]